MKLRKSKKKCTCLAYVNDVADNTPAGVLCVRKVREVDADEDQNALEALPQGNREVIVDDPKW